ncbi:MAG TPA: VWA domain-containing protein [Terriglobales bacterium]|nr:VWA domain-containing protein [Terriglobales bacterium]
MSALRGFRCAAVGAALLLLCAFAVPQSVPPGMGSIVPNTGGENSNSHEQPKIDLTTHTELVQVPVVVRDGSGAPIKGLKKEDFAVLENGKEQTISTFEEINTSAAPIKHPALSSSQFSNVYVGSPEPRRVTIMVLDSINTPYLDQTTARRELIKYLSKNFKSSDLVALMAMDRKGVHMIHDFSSSPEVLIAALRKVTGSLPNMNASDSSALANGADTSTLSGATTIDATSLDNEAASLQSFMDTSDNLVSQYRQADAVEDTFKSFLNIAQAFSGVPGRKSIVWLTGGLPFNLYDQSTTPTGRDLSGLYERTLQMMNNANIAVYPVDVRGLLNWGYGTASTSSPLGQSQQSFRTGGQVNIMTTSAIEAGNHQNLNDFAEMTGGRAFYNSNDLASGMQQASNDAAAYYVLGYYLGRKVDKAGWRKLKVKVNHPGAHVLARSGFFVTQATVDPSVDKRYDIVAALNSPLDSTALPIGMRWMGSDPVPGGDQYKIKFVIVAPSKTISVDASSKNHFSVEIVAQPRGSDGTPIQGAGIAPVIAGDLSPENLKKFQETGFLYSGALELPQGEYTVRFVMRDDISGNVGSLSAPLNVPILVPIQTLPKQPATQPKQPEASPKQ